MKKLIEQLGRTDIYLIDQILKGYFTSTQKVLDAGCGSGRNMKWFIENNFDIYGVDLSEEAIEELKNEYFKSTAKFEVSTIENLRYNNNFFDHVICSAVLHFATNKEQFKNMTSELIRVLKPGGRLFIRMASVFATPNSFEHLCDGRYILRDGSERFLLDQELLDEILIFESVILADPLKTTNVNDLRCMSTLVFEKI